NHPVGAFSQFNETFADAVIHVFLKISLTTRKAFQLLTCGARFVALKIAAQAVVFATVLFNRFAGEDVTIVGDGDIHHAHVNTERRVNVTFIGIGNVTNRQQVNRAFTVHKGGFTLAVLEQFKLALTALVVNPQTPADAPNADLPLVGVPRQQTIIVSNRAVFAE